MKDDALGVGGKHSLPMISRVEICSRGPACVVFHHQLCAHICGDSSFQSSLLSSAALHWEVGTVWVKCRTLDMEEFPSFWNGPCSNWWGWTSALRWRMWECSYSLLGDQFLLTWKEFTCVYNYNFNFSQGLSSDMPFYLITLVFSFAMLLFDLL